ncbi:GNAT family N-acetyltransferase, partial [Candidatus Poribacteria bacterium]|nr:GNAT family N-acetyltransferase [Candidatus Poribacteria bacterium]
LEAATFPRVSHLLTPVQPLYPLFASVVEGRQRGRIFADRATKPEAALVCHIPGRIYAVCGNPANRGFLSALPALLATGPPSETAWWGFVTDAVAWGAPLDIRFAGTLQKGRGISFDLHPETFRRRPDWRTRIPVGYEMRGMTGDLVDVTAAQLPEGFPFPWESADHFTANGFGLALWRGDEVASIAFAYAGAVQSGHIEIAIYTAEAHRRRGCATLACSTFIEHALDLGMTPTWHCDAGNPGSIALATTLGFQRRGEHTMYSLPE